MLCLLLAEEVRLGAVQLVLGGERSEGAEGSQRPEGSQLQVLQAEGGPLARHRGRGVRVVAAGAVRWVGGWVGGWSGYVDGKGMVRKFIVLFHSN